MAMNKISAQYPAAVIVLLCILYVGVDSASAHRVNVFAWVEGDTIYVEGKFSGGKKVKSGKIVVTDPRGNKLLSGLTNDQGEFSFKVPQRTDLKIVLIAGQGHQAKWTIRAAEMEDLPSKTASDESAEKAVQSEPKKAVAITSVDARTAAPDTALKPEELEAIIETVLDRKLKPITRMLVDIRQDAPSVGDIFAGIGYILGLVGIAAYVQSRKKKE
jgi:nickel transport protein